ncbi:uncharacterized protein TNCV_4286221 [Trichonephila clavipes]|nr:uncharacterized protein TNCV_4286221 [Trichonephila clavipes]
MERTSDPLPTLQCPRNRQLRRRRFNGRAGIMLDGLPSLHVFERGSVTSVWYRDEVSEPYVRLFGGACDPEFIIMDDNVRPYRALLVDEFLDCEDICRMDWPATSPDLDSIEYV